MPRFRYILAIFALIATTLFIGCQSDDDPADAVTVTQPLATAPTIATVTVTASDPASPPPVPTPSPPAPTANDLAAFGDAVVPQFPSDVAMLDDGRIAVVDLGFPEVQIFNPEGTLDRRWNASVQLPDNPDNAFPPGQIAFANDALYVATAIRSHLTRYDLDGNVVASHAFENPNLTTNDLVAGPDGRIYLIAGGDQGQLAPDEAHGVSVFNPNLDLLNTWTPPAPTVVRATTVDPDGIVHLLLYDHANANGKSERGQSAAIVRIDPDTYAEDAWGQPVKTSFTGQFDGLLVTDSGNYILVEESSTSSNDSDVTTVYRVDSEGNPLAEWKLPGQGGIGMSFAPGLALTENESIIMSDPQNQRLLEVSLAGEIIRTIEDEQAGHLARPSGMTIGPDGDVYIADAVLGVIKRFSPDGSFVEAIPFEFTHADPFFFYPVSIDFDDDGQLYLASGAAAPAEALSVLSPDGNQRIIEVDDPIDLASERRFILDPEALAIGPDGVIYVSMNQQSWVRGYSSDGELVVDWPADPDSVLEAHNVVAGADGVFAVVARELDDQRAIAIQRIDEEGEPIAIFQTGRPEEPPIEGAVIALPTDIALDNDGFFYILDQQQESVVILSPDGDEISRFDVSDDTDRVFNSIAVDPEGRIYVSDLHQREVLVYAPSSE